jgi:hypothetical protein
MSGTVPESIHSFIKFNEYEISHGFSLYSNSHFNGYLFAVVKRLYTIFSELFQKGSARLKVHLRHYHSVEEEAKRAAYRFECPDCSKKIRTKGLLDSHRKVVHKSEGKTERCPFCKYEVPRKRKSDIDRFVFDCKNVIPC